MNTSEIVQKLWDLCNVLRDDGITYHQYVTELTYILFLKMAKETGAEKDIPPAYRWDKLSKKSGLTLKNFYDELLKNLGSDGNGIISDIYCDAVSNIKSPNNLEKIVARIDELDWYSAREEGLGDLYEGLLEKNANEKKSGAGQYFTPRVLIDVIVRLTKPQAGERCNDPACGTFGFMIAAAQYVRDHTDDFFDLPQDLQKFEVDEAFTGCELVPDIHRLALMNAALHDLHGKIMLADTLSSDGQRMKNFDVVLSNPPFGTKRGGERATRDDFVFSTSNKQLNFLQHIYRSLKPGGRAAVVLPDNVLFADGDGERIRVDLMDKCNLHTILRLPTGIFYAQGVKTNVLFFSRGFSDYDNTDEVWFYDLRTNMPSFGKTNPLTRETFADFERAYDATDRRAVHDERFSVFIREEISAKGNSLDLGLIRDISAVDFDELPDPRDTCVEILASLAKASALISETLDQLNATGTKKNASLPSNWRLTNLGDVCNFIGGGTPSKEIAEYWNGNIPWASVKDIKGDYLLYTVDKISEEGLANSSANLCEIDDLILVTRIEPAKTIVAKIIAAVNQDLKIVKSLLPSKFLHYLFQFFKSDIESRASGSTVKGITIDTLKNFQIPLPPLSEQKRIVARLDSLFEKLDAAAEILQAVIAGGELRRSAILHRAFSGELTASWREEHGVLLDDWQECKLGDVIQISKQTTDNFDAVDLKYVGLENIESGGRISFQSANEVKSTKNIFHAGDLLYGKLRPYLDKHGVAEFDGVCSTDILVFDANKKSSNRFVNYFLSLPSFIEYAVSNSRGINLPRVTGAVVLNAKIPLPPLAEQEEIARVVGSLLEREAQATALVESSLAEIGTLRKAILGRAFRGELGTNDPSESVLEFELEE